MQWNREWKPLATIISVFVLCYYLPVERLQGDLWPGNPLWEALYLVRWYAQEHVLLCLVPAFLIAGAVGVFVSQAAVMKYLGPTANKFLAYGVASVSGTVLAVCSCTILPLFAGIYRMGAGLGPASAFLYSGPAINILAIVLTASVLGPEMGIARAIGAVVFSVLIGLLMHLFFRKEELQKVAAAAAMPEPEVSRPLWQVGIYFASMVGVLVFANWGKPQQMDGLWHVIWANKWLITSLFAVLLGQCLVWWFRVRASAIFGVAIPVAFLAILYSEQPLIAFVVGVFGLCLILNSRKDNEELEEWFATSWDFAKKILPLLFYGVLIAGALLGRPGHEGLIPSVWIANLVGGNGFGANLMASVLGAFMYFATLTEVPILQGLIGAGMGKGPALALLLAGPALSLPNMLVIRSVMGTKKTVVFVCLVIVMATISGLIYGTF
ncbi:MAG: permease [Desulfuromonas sp.]|nr:permease [Desulfuromonas sp.]